MKTSVVNRVTTHTSSVLAFVNEQPAGQITRFILLDHMDWLSRDPKRTILTEEWQGIMDKAAPHARVLWRSAGLDGEFINTLPIKIAGNTRDLGELLSYNRELATTLHAKDRVHTYGSFCIADLKR